MTLLCAQKSQLTQPVEVNLYEGAIPGAKESANRESVECQNESDRFIVNVSRPQLFAYLPNADTNTGCAVIICPGGGYRGVSIDLEGHAIAQQFVKKGISAFVLKYRMPSVKTMDNPQVGPLQDLQQALFVVHSRAKEWAITSGKIGVMGFSAGGHLASSAAVHYQSPVSANLESMQMKPAFQLLVYPVITMEKNITHPGSRARLLGEAHSSDDERYFSNEIHVHDTTPPAFLLHASDDTHVPVENTLRYYKALQDAEVSVDMLILPHGGHGFGLNHSTDWFKAVLAWMSGAKLLN